VTAITLQVHSQANLVNSNALLLQETNTKHIKFIFTLMGHSRSNQINPESFETMNTQPHEECHKILVLQPAL